jgi:hypothetical protein
MRKSWLLLAFGLLVAALSVGAIACEDDEKTAQEAEAQLCQDLDKLAQARAQFDNLSSTSTVDDVRNANEAYNDALSDVVDSARDVQGVQTQAIQDAYDDLAQAIDDIPGDATIEQALTSIESQVAAVDAAWAQALGGVDCP